MGKIVKFKVDYKISKEYRESLNEIISNLSKLESELFDSMVSLAMTGKWKEWSDSQPFDTVCNFTEDMLIHTGDRNIDEIARLMYEVIFTKEKILLINKLSGASRVSDS